MVTAPCFPYAYYALLCYLQTSGEFPMDCPLHDSLLRVHYKGTLLDEPKSVFYDTRFDNDGEPLEFCSGEGLVSTIASTFDLLYNNCTKRCRWNLTTERTRASILDFAKLHLVFFLW